MRTAFNCPGPNRTTAWALLYEGQHAGTLAADYSDAGVCIATLSVWSGQLHLTDAEGLTNSRTGRAGGYGYDKLSAAVADAFSRAGDKDAAVTMDARGATAVRRFFEGFGYQVVEVL